MASTRANTSVIRDSTQHTGSWRATLVNIQRWLKLDAFTMLQMLKGGLPPLIVIAMYQATSIANIESTIGYLSAILTVSAQCLLPRAKFMKIMFFSVLAICAGAALSCVVVVCCVRVRPHTSPAGDYNSSASVISAIWLLFGIWLANAIRVHRPAELQDPMVALSIFLVVALTSTPTFVTISDGLDFVRRLLITFMIGLAIATGVSLLILPITSRRNFFRLLDTFSKDIDDLLKCQIEFVREKANVESDLWHEDLDGRTEVSTTSGDLTSKSVESRLEKLGGDLSKINAELTYIKIEVAWGKLSPNDFAQICDHLSAMYLSLAGLSMLPEILQTMLDHLRTQQGWKEMSNDASTKKEFQKPTWQNMVRGLEARLISTRELIANGIDATFQLLEVPRADDTGDRSPSWSTDVEKQSLGREVPALKASEFFNKEISKYIDRRQNLHQIWPSLMFPSQAQAADPITEEEGDAQAGEHEVKEHLLVFLFMEQLQNDALQVVHELLSFAEDKVKTESMRRNRLIVPSLQISELVAPLADIWHHHSSTGSIYPSSSAQTWTSKDAEHLEPANWWERCGTQIRIMSKLLTSRESKFGARVALASVCVAILAYVRQTHTWFTEERIIWVMIVIVIGMKADSGASTFGYLARIGGTTVSMILSLIVWYIVDGNTAGVLVFLYFANVFEYYFWVRFPQQLGPCTIMIVTLNVIVANELQVKKLGVERATSDGQPYLPIYIFGPYKLLSVIIAVTISFIWTIFPSPASARSQVRINLAHGLFLLSNFHSCTHQTVKLWINEQQGNMQDANSMGRRLQTLNQALFSQQIGLTSGTQSLIHWTAYEIPLGGKFPQRAYVSAISTVQLLTTCMALMTHATRGVESLQSTPTSNLNTNNVESGLGSTSAKQDRWIRQLARATDSAEFNAHTNTSILCQLAGAIASNTALSPHLSPSKNFLLAQKLREINVHAMQINNIQYPEFLAFATMEVIASLINKRLRDMIEVVKDLVGEIDFDLKFQDKDGKAVKVH